MVAMLTRPTLVLNRNWQPVGVASVARSLTLVAAERRTDRRSERLPAVHVGRLVAADPAGGRARSSSRSSSGCACRR